MAEPLAADLAALLGKSEDASTISRAQEHLPVVLAMVKAYTRSRDFTESEPNDDVALVVVSSRPARGQPRARHRAGHRPVQHPASHFYGWTLPELAVLHQYRNRAA